MHTAAQLVDNCCRTSRGGDSDVVKAPTRRHVPELNVLFELPEAVLFGLLNVPFAPTNQIDARRREQNQRCH